MAGIGANLCTLVQYRRAHFLNSLCFLVMAPYTSAIISHWYTLGIIQETEGTELNLLITEPNSLPTAAANVSAQAITFKCSSNVIPRYV